MHYRARKQILKERLCSLCINTLKMALLSKLAAKAADKTAYIYNDSLAVSKDFGCCNKLIAVLLRIFL